MKASLRLPLPILLLLSCLGPALRAAEPVAEPTEEKVTLPKFEANGNAVCCYGFGIVVTWNNKTQHIEHVYIDYVTPGSKAERIGLKIGDEILSLNGIKITSMKGGTKRGSDLFELLVDQPVGRMIDIEVAVRVVKKYVLTAIP
jgi:predicted metalloprotease with PDZ domain